MLTESKIQKSLEPSPSSDDDDYVAILAKPLDSRPPPRAGKRVLPNFGLDAL
jgi:hypothetical protein